MRTDAGTYTAPVFAGDTVYAWSEILDKAFDEHPGVGGLRLRTVAAKDRSCDYFPYRSADGKYEPQVVLDFDYTVPMPQRI